MHGHQLKSNCANLDLWLELQPVLFSRWLDGTWVRSHLTQAQFEEQFGSENLWAFASNTSADEAAGKFSTWLDGQQILSTWVGIRRWRDRMNFQVVQYLTARVMRVLKAPKEGPKRVSRLEFLEGLPLFPPLLAFGGFAVVFFLFVVWMAGERCRRRQAVGWLCGFECFRTTRDWLEHSVVYPWA